MVNAVGPSDTFVDLSVFLSALAFPPVGHFDAVLRTNPYFSPPKKERRNPISLGENKVST